MPDSKPSVAIVGAGFGGVGMGIRLRRAGYTDFTIFERGDSVGGVWRANSYPGAACDVPSHLYSFSFAPGHRWSRRYAPRAEILDYLEDRVREYGLEPHLRLSTELASAEFDEASGRWTVRTAGGEAVEADILVTACGQLTNPQTPALPGLEDFAGVAFHSAEWDHDHDLKGSKVAVVGAGASAIQFVPEIVDEIDEMTIYQRSAPWIVPKMDRRYPRWERWLFRRFRPRVAAARLTLFTFFEGFTHAFTGRYWIMRPFTAIADRERNRRLPEGPLRDAATPDYKMGCKRVLFSSDWFPTLARDNVDLVNGRIERVTERGVVGPDGVERETDTIIFGTGFRSHDFVAPLAISGLGGRSLDEVWSDRPEAYLGMTVAGFPNMFVLYGPNTNHGSGSVPYTLECQFRYVLDAMRRMHESGLRYLDVRPESQTRWREELARRSVPTVWLTGGCENWYITEQGANTNNWPAGWLEYRRRTRRLDPADYRAAV